MAAVEAAERILKRERPKPSRLKGTVKFWKEQSWGVIVQDSGEPDLFVHYSGISSGGFFKSLAPGERVEYTVQQGPPGPKAVHVVKLKED